MAGVPSSEIHTLINERSGYRFHRPVYMRASQFYRRTLYFPGTCYDSQKPVVVTALSKTSLIDN